MRAPGTSERRWQRRNLAAVPRDPAAIPETDLAAIRRFCEQNSPAEHAHHLRVEFGVRGKAVTIYECRPPWDDDGSEWTRQPIGQLRYDPQDQRWRLFWADRNDRWHAYEMLGPAGIKRVLTELDSDPTCIFWG